MLSLNLGVIRNNKYVRYGTISTVAVLGVMSISYLCYSKVKDDICNKLSIFTKKSETTDLNNKKEDNKDNKENN